MAEPGKRGKPYIHELTAADIREAKGAEYIEVIFLESVRFHRLLRNNAAFERILAMLRESVAKHRAVKVRFASIESDVIQNVEE
jgi:hypothetical protein